MEYSILNLSLTQLRERTSMKWQRYAPDVLPLWVAEMDVHLAEPVRDAMIAAIRTGDTGYPEGPVYENAWIEFAAERWGQQLELSQLTLGPDVMQSISVLIHTLTKPGDRIVLNSPVYPPFYDVITDAGREVWDIPLTGEGRLDLAALEAAFTDHEAQRPSAYLLCNPHNPTATAHSTEELAAVAALARRGGVRVIVDEIHAPLVHSGGTFVPYLSLPDAQADFVVLSASKAWNLAAYKAALIVGGAEAGEDQRRLPYGATRGAAAHSAVLAHVAALQHGGPWLEQLLRELTANHRLLTELLSQHLPLVTYQPGQATYLAWLDCRELGLAAPARHFLHEARVALNDGKNFGAAYGGFVRMNLATSPDLITEAVTRMAASL